MSDQPPPYDRALALASLVRTMRDHYLDVSCSCGAHRVVAIKAMARDRRFANLTLAHVALKLACEGCFNGPDRVYLAATHFGCGPSSVPAIGLAWTMPLLERPTKGAKHLRQRKA